MLNETVFFLNYFLHLVGYLSLSGLNNSIFQQSLFKQNQQQFYKQENFSAKHITFLPNRLYLWANNDVDSDCGRRLISFSIKYDNTTEETSNNIAFK